MFKYIVFHFKSISGFIFLLIAINLGHLIHFLSLDNISNCLNNTLHTHILHYLTHLDLALNSTLANQATNIGGRRLALSLLQDPLRLQGKPPLCWIYILH
jgi:hypothetical protein